MIVYLPPVIPTPPSLSSQFEHHKQGKKVCVRRQSLLSIPIPTSNSHFTFSPLERRHPGCFVSPGPQSNAPFELAPGCLDTPAVAHSRSPRRVSRRFSLVRRFCLVDEKRNPSANPFLSPDIIDDSDDYVTDVEEESTLPDSQVDVNATLRAAARAARIKKMEQFRRETGLAAFSERVEASLPQRRKAAAPAPVVAPAPAAAPTPAPLDRGVEAKQPWIARLFGVKGKSTVKYLCFAVSRGRTLRKVIAQLHAWKSHGIEELVADPKRGMVWVTVSAKNCEYFSFPSFLPVFFLSRRFSHGDLVLTGICLCSSQAQVSGLRH